MSAGVTWYSASKGEDVEIATMSLPQARNTLAKLLRGEATNSEGKRLPFSAEQVVRDALEQRILGIEAERGQA